jgi:hypothetical protein
MKTSRIALLAFAVIAGIGALTASTQNSRAGGLGLDWLSNKPYVECIRRASMLADVSSIMRGPAYREQSYDLGRRQCNRKHYGRD